MSLSVDVSAYTRDSVRGDLADMEAVKRIEKLRSLMRAHGIDVYMIPTGDFHGSEYISEYFKCRSYVTGFTGSAGTVVVTGEEAGLWTDGRYFLQAETELAGSGIRLFKSGEQGVEEPEEYIGRILTPGMRLGFDGRTMTAEKGCALESLAMEMGAEISRQVDLVGEMWEDRPPLITNPIVEYDEAMAGKSYLEKLKEIRGRFKGKNTKILVSALDDIAWILNLRGSDISYNPVFFAHLIVSEEETALFVYGERMDEVKELRPEIGVREYGEIYESLAAMEGGSLLLDKSSVNFALFKSIPSTVEILPVSNADYIPKHIKNDTEAEGMRRVHIRDGAAVTEFIYRLKKRAASGEAVTEKQAAAMLEGLRERNEEYRGASFEPIVAYGRNGAIIHYCTEQGVDAVIEREGFLLADTGGQYLCGTTDVTRTVCMGPLTYEQKKNYTAVLKGNLALAMSRFPKGTGGDRLDAVAREPLLRLGLDYNHGTGHGVGCYLNVHEGPPAFRKKRCIGMEKGMIISDEPGVYFDGQYGIRLENLLLCREAGEGLLGFEILTLVPFEREAVLTEELTEDERVFLNEYHSRVRSELLPYMDREEAEWLIAATEGL